MFLPNIVICGLLAVASPRPLPSGWGGPSALIFNAEECPLLGSTVSKTAEACIANCAFGC
jgi:hypothetical protein